MVRVGQGGGKYYVEFLVAGLLPWFAFNEGLIRSTTSVIDNAALVRKLPLNMQVLVLVPNASAIVFEVIGLLIFTIFLVVRGTPPTGIWILPFAILIQFVLQAGLGMVLATANVFFRDLTHIVGFVLSILFYLSPILYPAQGRFEKVFAWNPLSALLGLYRRAFLSGIPAAAPVAAIPDALSIVLTTTLAVALFAAGSAMLTRAHGELVDLI
jgi:lipopolysaccharide transport system permease protein